MLPRKPDQKSPIVRLFVWFKLFVCPCLQEKDAENAGICVTVEHYMGLVVLKSEKHLGWSGRMVANVTGEIENVMHKVHFADP